MYSSKESRNEFVANWYKTIATWQSDLRKAQR
jgi:hypothetical protein